MAQKRKADQSHRMIDAAMSLADEKGWRHVSPRAVGARAKLSPSAVPEGAADIFEAVLKNLVSATAREARPRMGDSPRDNLLEILMTRLDLMQAHRKGFLSIPAFLAETPCLPPRLLRPFAHDMADMLEQAGYTVQKQKRPVLAAAMGALYLSVLYTWKADDSADLAKTMAVVDKRIDLLEKLLKR